MPTDQDHISQAQRNLDFLETFLEGYNFNDWSITVAFYACVHIAESAIFLQKNLKYRGTGLQLEHSDELPNVASRANLAPPRNLSWTAKLNHIFRNVLIAENFPEIWAQYDYLYKKSKESRYCVYKWNNNDIDLIMKYSPSHIIGWLKQKFQVDLKVTKKLLKP